jgi:predicted metal-dependent enzyme (double-stranded beta helix superfamily)
VSSFSIEGFADGCKLAMAGADDKRQAAKTFLEKTMTENETTHIIEVLNAAIPEGADIGEMIVHTSPELTMLYARVPPKFQSAIHNHTLFACIGQLAGEEFGTLYERTADRDGLNVVGTETTKAGEVTSLPENAIHHIENPKEISGSALHVYGGDFGAVMGRRSVWTTEGHEEKPFDFQVLLAESVSAMKKRNNTMGLAELVKAIPAVKPLVEAP